uniref:vegetative cell wall protein gp1-like n=1 Tax=Jaculus jaculus TaxID=51337 RepID=UPI001E1B3306|nr:vegetative cell wall protein gp1-like [Jaculus jaculus]
MACPAAPHPQRALFYHATPPRAPCCLSTWCRHGPNAPSIPSHGRPGVLHAPSPPCAPRPPGRTLGLLVSPFARPERPVLRQRAPHTPQQTRPPCPPKLPPRKPRAPSRPPHAQHPQPHVPLRTQCTPNPVHPAACSAPPNDPPRRIPPPPPRMPLVTPLHAAHLPPHVPSAPLRAQAATRSPRPTPAPPNTPPHLRLRRPILPQLAPPILHTPHPPRDPPNPLCMPRTPTHPEHPAPRATQVHNESLAPAQIHPLPVHCHTSPTPLRREITDCVQTPVYPPESGL